ncbi:DUF4349 domain-containing protein [Aquipuribacter sp. SD81]|uniref:DUF4349 domain-containing protein n=1 Tax=Aquipuribacter sp. SD81 TaxID=3127703 RepID=UPI00301A58EB
MTTSRTVLALLVALLLGLTLAACGADSGATESVADDAVGASGEDGWADAREAPQEADAEGEAAGGAVEDAGEAAGEGAGVPAEGGAAGADADAEAAQAAAAGSGTAVAAAGAVERGRRIVTTTLDVAVEDVARAARQVRDAAVVAGGYVQAEETVGGEQPSAVLTLRVPVEGTGDVMTRAAALGQEVNRTSDVEEVETRIVDLESRVATQRAGVERVRSLLAGAEDLEDVLALERELTRRQADLEALDAQRAALTDRAALATVTVRLTLPEDVEPVEAVAPPFLRGLQGGWDALAASTGVVLVVVGSLLPFAVVALVLGGVALLVVRAVRRAAPTRPAPAPPAAHNEA